MHLNSLKDLQSGKYYGNFWAKKAVFGTVGAPKKPSSGVPNGQNCEWEI